jgi:predicted DNA binding CopG/RHH family protein
MLKKDFSFQKRKPDVDAPEADKDTDQDIQRFIAGRHGTITRKTIALPEEDFIRVKVEAAKRGIPAYQLWGEIIDAYFKNAQE